MMTIIITHTYTTAHDNLIKLNMIQIQTRQDMSIRTKPRIKKEKKKSSWTSFRITAQRTELLIYSDTITYILRDSWSPEGIPPKTWKRMNFSAQEMYDEIQYMCYDVISFSLLFLFHSHLISLFHFHSFFISFSFHFVISFSFHFVISFSLLFHFILSHFISLFHSHFFSIFATISLSATSLHCLRGYGWWWRWREGYI